jgi:hypothetical protein
MNPNTGPTVTDQELVTFRGILSMGAWFTRTELSFIMNWSPRKVREAAEQLGAEVVRCQKGFKLTCLLTTTEISDGEHAIRAFKSQAEKMQSYAEALRVRLLEMAAKDSFFLET